MSPENWTITPKRLEELKIKLEGCHLSPAASRLINLFLDSSPECLVKARLPSERESSLSALAQFAPMAAIETLLPFAQDQSLTKLGKTEVLLAFATNHTQAVWEIIRRGEAQEKFWVRPKDKKEETLLVFIHTAQVVEIKSLSGQEAMANIGQKKTKLLDLFLPQGAEVKRGNWVVVHCGWVITKIDEGLVKKILIAQEKIRLDDKKLFQFYSQLPQEINFKTVFGGLFSGQRR